MLVGVVALGVVELVFAIDMPALNFGLHRKGIKGEQSSAETNIPFIRFMGFVKWRFLFKYLFAIASKNKVQRCDFMVLIAYFRLINIPNKFTNGRLEIAKNIPTA